MKHGKLNQFEKSTLTKALAILNHWAEYTESVTEGDPDDLFDDYKYSHAMNAMVGLNEFLAEEDKEG